MKFTKENLSHITNNNKDAKMELDVNDITARKPKGKSLGRKVE